MSTPTPPKDLAEHFFKNGFNYYVVGRFAVVAGLAPEAGNLLHHAIELFLKGQLSRKFATKELKGKFMHRLNDLWDAFKAEFPGEELKRFDELIGKIHDFEEIRYPDVLAEKGALIVFSTAEPPKEGEFSASFTKTYTISLQSVDDLVNNLFRLVSLNAVFFSTGKTTAAREYLNIGNEQEPLRAK